MTIPKELGLDLSDEHKEHFLIAISYFQATKKLYSNVKTSIHSKIKNELISVSEGAKAFVESIKNLESASYTGLITRLYSRMKKENPYPLLIWSNANLNLL